MGIVERHKDVVDITARHGQSAKVHGVRRKQASRLGVRRQVCIETQHDIRLARSAFQLQPVENGNTIGNCDEFKVAGAFLFKCRFHLGARAPFGSEAFVGVDSELAFGGGQAACQGKNG